MDTSPVEKTWNGLKPFIGGQHTVYLLSPPSNHIKYRECFFYPFDVRSVSLGYENFIQAFLMLEDKQGRSMRQYSSGSFRGKIPLFGDYGLKTQEFIQDQFKQLFSRLSPPEQEELEKIVEHMVPNPSTIKFKISSVKETDSSCNVTVTENIERVVSSFVRTFAYEQERLKAPLEHPCDGESIARNRIVMQSELLPVSNHEIPPDGTLPGVPSPRYTVKLHPQEAYLQDDGSVILALPKGSTTSMVREAVQAWVKNWRETLRPLDGGPLGDRLDYFMNECRRKEYDFESLVGETF